jgi:hypothetical protein
MNFLPSDKKSLLIASKLFVYYHQAKKQAVSNKSLVSKKQREKSFFLVAQVSQDKN